MFLAEKKCLRTERNVRHECPERATVGLPTFLQMHRLNSKELPDDYIIFYSPYIDGNTKETKHKNNLSTVPVSLSQPVNSPLLWITTFEFVQ